MMWDDRGILFMILLKMVPWEVGWNSTSRQKSTIVTLKQSMNFFFTSRPKGLISFFFYRATPIKVCVWSPENDAGLASFPGARKIGGSPSWCGVNVHVYWFASDHRANIRIIMRTFHFNTEANVIIVSHGIRWKRSELALHRLVLQQNSERCTTTHAQIILLPKLERW